jgi:hypothetical protein
MDRLIRVGNSLKLRLDRFVIVVIFKPRDVKLGSEGNSFSIYRLALSVGYGATVCIMVHLRSVFNLAVNG